MLKAMSSSVLKTFRSRNMLQNHSLAESIMDASWGAFLDILVAKAENAGHQVIWVNPRYTSQKCHTCGEIVQKSLSVRTHSCPFCGYIADRDVNGVGQKGEAASLPTPRCQGSAAAS